jgi:hypothetical protein
MVAWRAQAHNSFEPSTVCSKIEKRMEGKASSLKWS